jgi:hypothetical protein
VGPIIEMMAVIDLGEKTQGLYTWRRKQSQADSDPEIT